MEKDFYELIEKYNLGKLPAADLEKFEAEMLLDPDLAEAVREHRTQREMQELMAEDLLRAEIRKRFSEPPPEPDFPKSSQNWFSKNWKFALPALLILGTAGFFISKKFEKRSGGNSSKFAADRSFAGKNARKFTDGKCPGFGKSETRFACFKTKNPRRRIQKTTQPAANCAGKLPRPGWPFWDSRSVGQGYFDFGNEGFF